MVSSVDIRFLRQKKPSARSEPNTSSALLGVVAVPSVISAVVILTQPTKSWLRPNELPGLIEGDASRRRSGRILAANSQVRLGWPPHRRLFKMTPKRLS